VRADRFTLSFSPSYKVGKIVAKAKRTTFALLKIDAPTQENKSPAKMPRSELPRSQQGNKVFLTHELRHEFFHPLIWILIKIFYKPNESFKKKSNER